MQKCTICTPIGGCTLTHAYLHLGKTVPYFRKKALSSGRKNGSEILLVLTVIWQNCEKYSGKLPYDILTCNKGKAHRLIIKCKFDEKSH